MVMRHDIDTGEVVSTTVPQTPVCEKQQVALTSAEEKQQPAVPSVAANPVTETLLQPQPSVSIKPATVDTPAPAQSQENSVTEPAVSAKEESAAAESSMQKVNAYDEDLANVKSVVKVLWDETERVIRQYPDKKTSLYEGYLLPSFLKMFHRVNTGFKPRLRDECFENAETVGKARQALSSVIDLYQLSQEEKARWSRTCRVIIDSVSIAVRKLDGPIAGKYFDKKVLLPSLEKIGCEYEAAPPLIGLTSSCQKTSEGVVLTVSGTPTAQAGSKVPVLALKPTNDPEVFLRIFPFAKNYREAVISDLMDWYRTQINESWKPWMITLKPDPEKMWTYKPADEHMKFWKQDFDSACCDAPPGFNVIGGSQKGRSHWHVGSARDDDFAVAYDAECGWNLLVVCDGAGSKKYSREGSKIVANSLKENVIKMITPKAEKFFRDFVINKTDAAREKAQHALYQCFIATEKRQSGSLHRAFMEVRDAAVAEKCSVNDFATTLLCVIVKKYEEGWFFGSFMVGDGAIALYDDSEPGGVLLLGDPDEGEYSGQTRFFTMDSVWTNGTELFNRLRVETKPDFTALFLMTDGVSDPKFETVAQLNNKAKWKALYDEIFLNVLKNQTPKVAATLLGEHYLKFYSEGNHDDRTLVMMYRGEQ